MARCKRCAGVPNLSALATDAIKSLFVICSAVSCPSFLKAQSYTRYLKTTLRGAKTMHEIPNFPYPNLQATEQANAQQASAQPAEPSDAADSQTADSED